VQIVNGILRGSVRGAARALFRSPSLTLGIVLSFALGIGANAVMFEVVDRLLLSPPTHVANADRVKRLMVDRISPNTKTRETTDVMSYPDYMDFTRVHGFASVAAFSKRTLTVGHGLSARRYDATLVTGKFFSLLGVTPELGRLFGSADDKPGAPGIVVISHAVWQNDFGGDPHVVGRTIDFGHGQYVITGVAPPGFTGMDLARVDMWLPLRVASSQMWSSWQWVDNRNMNWLRVVARVAPIVPVQTADAEATLVHRQGRGEQIGEGKYDPKVRVIAAPLIAARGPLASPESKVAQWLAGISLLVLLIACANVANLLLARAMRRRRETGIRLALGSSRAQVIGHALTESLMLAGLGGVAALLLTRVGGDLLRSLVLPDIAWTEPHLMLHVVAFIVVVALLAGIVAGVIPAMQASRVDVVETIKTGASRNTSGSASRTRDALVILQVALSVLLLVGAGLFVHSLNNATSIHLGFDPTGVFVVSPEFDHDTGTADAVRDAEFTRRGIARLKSLPGVELVSVDLSTPFESAFSVDLKVPGLDSIPVLPSGPPIIHTVGPDYFSMMHLRILKGRGIRTDDNHIGAARVAVVNTLMARMLWPSRDAIGQCLVVYDGDASKSAQPPCATVVGVADVAALQSVTDAAPMQFYVARDAGIVTPPFLDILVRARGDGEQLVPAIRKTLVDLDPSVRFLHIDPLQNAVDRQTSSWRLGARTFTAFGMLALIVAGIGLYSVLAFSVAQRTFEIGVRTALGATPMRLARMVLGEAGRLIAIGVVIGLAAAVAVAPRAQALLFNVSPRDPATLLVVVCSVVFVSTVAAIVPARRAILVDPSVALRSE
jgi:predicted permease